MLTKGLDKPAKATVITTFCLDRKRYILMDKVGYTQPKLGLSSDYPKIILELLRIRNIQLSQVK